MRRPTHEPRSSRREGRPDQPSIVEYVEAYELGKVQVVRLGCKADAPSRLEVANHDHIKSQGTIDDFRRFNFVLHGLFEKGVSCNAAQAYFDSRFSIIHLWQQLYDRRPCSVKIRGLAHGDGIKDRPIGGLSGYSSNQALREYIDGWTEHDLRADLHKHLSGLPEAWRLEGRLSAQDLVDLVAGYQAGATSRELAGQYGISKTALVHLLRRQGVQIRSRGSKHRR